MNPNRLGHSRGNMSGVWASETLNMKRRMYVCMYLYE